MKYYPLIITSFFLAISCESPLKPPPAEDSEFFVSHDYAGTLRLIKKIPITLEWSQLKFNQFEQYSVYRSQSDGNGETWIKRAEIFDPMRTTFTDTLDNDLTFRFKIQAVFSDGELKEATTEPIVIKTTSVTVPDECDCLQDAYDAPFIDDGDTIYVGEMTVCTVPRPLVFLDKDVVIKSLLGKTETVIERSRMLLSMSRGKISGFTFKHGWIDLHGTAMMTDCIVTEARLLAGRGPLIVRETAEVNNSLISGNSNHSFWNVGGEGAGVLLEDQATIRNCRISDNRTSESGGGILARGEPTIQNCIIDNNRAAKGGGGLFTAVSANPTIINCVLYGNRSGISDAGSGAIFQDKASSFTILNSIVWGNSAAEGADLLWRSASYSDIEYNSDGTENIDADPLFVDPASGDFRLQPGSPGIDAGHPDAQYNDANGSRNDMGAFGGPYGEWQPDGL
ncbi:MAG: right-handed parallel beta-helix repeat-containing protein [Candidatus Marinimicrobia bacterium]|jgi:hypothetical protein|nr:hypothetical protein [Candidatus Neomarinimicrobiota bacterium]MDP6455929.1 right-handed parallel beta-helix repeat-containing protein [Candidatus Neomarinimicrobiota bacterium]MDP6592993.1 right-handed parallel beta-helix repeat-containing protein [Candidatus Neomarinimicrobiota bacterium]MDP6835921.1 right-handed parallel beta-helix repeat-containing protein [Candidatus Neomarinimicrobiota bacterium]MDP6967434.1 right-handed parallel beta-helix repeat-containing protein [Candidatus Neomari|tara:strand:- start:185 stop:1540 length:1356 start_codon:yes stop_codon:yes gene_type:complete